MSQKVIYDGKPENYDHLIESGYEFRLGAYVNRGWEIFKEYPGGFIGFMLLTIVLGGMASMIPFLGIGILYCFYAGTYIVCDKIAGGEEYEFSDFFGGFDHFMQMMIAGVLVTIFTSIGFALLIIPGIYLAVGYLMVVPLISLERLEFWDAMEVSRKVVSKNWFMFLLFAIVAGILASLGVVAFFIGIIITLPLSTTMMYAAYEDIFMTQEYLEEEIEEMGEIYEEE